MSTIYSQLKATIALGIGFIALSSFSATNQSLGDFGGMDKMGLTAPKQSATQGVSRNASREIRKMSGSPITEAPTGKYVPCYVDYSMCWFQAAGGGGLAGFPLMGKPMHYIVTEDNEFYLYNPIFLRPFDGDSQQLCSYVKGTLDGNKVTFQYPQPMGEVDVYGDGSRIEIAYINKMEMINDAEGNAAFVNLAEEHNFQTYTIDEEGNLKMDGMTDAYADIIGLSTEDGAWTGYGTWDWRAKAIDPTPLTPPAEMQVERYFMKDDFSSGFVNIGIDGDDFWIQGLSRTYLPEAWVKGKIEGHTITIPRCEFIGEVEAVGEYAWVAGILHAEDVVLDENGEAQVSQSTLMDLQFEANEDFSEFKATKQIVINPNTIIYYALESYAHASISKLPDDFTPTPQAATITSFNVSDEGGLDLWFKYPRNTEGGIPLESSNLYYEIYMPDGELYTFTTEIYPALSEDMSLIPRSTYVNGVFTAQGSNINVQLIATGLKNIGVKTVYIEEGERYEAETVYALPLGIEAVADCKGDIIEYYNLQGVRVANPGIGCFFKVTTTTDGHRNTEKVILK